MESNETKKNDPLSRSVRVKLDAAVAKVLRENQAQVQQLSAVLQTVSMMDQRLVGALVATAGHKLDQFQRWEYEDGKDGVTSLVLIPAPLPMPEPQKPMPQSLAQTPQKEG